MVILIILLISLLRLIVVPAVYVSSGYASKIQSTAGTNNLDEAVLLVSFEFICTTMLILCSKKISRIRRMKNTKVEELHTIFTTPVKIIIFLLIIIAIGCVIANKSVLVSITTIFERFFGSDQAAIERRINLLEIRSNSSLVFNLFFQTVFYLQVIIPACLISYAAKNRNTKNENKGFYAALLFSLLSTLFVTDNNIDSICILLACILVVNSIYSQKMRKLFPFLITIIGVFIALFLLAKVGLLSSKEISLKEISETLNAYFSSLPNVSCSFSMQYENKIMTFFGDIIAGVPYMTALFRGFPKSVTIFNATAYDSYGTVNQIMPLISSGYQFLGIFAPTFTIITYNIALNCEYKFKKSTGVFEKILYALMFINLSVGPCIFGFPNTIKRLCLYIPFVILIALNKRSSRNYKKGLI